MLQDIEQLRKQYEADLGEIGVKFMTFCIEQNIQLDLLRGLTHAISEKDAELTDKLFKAFGVVHASLTESMSKALDLSEEESVRIFNAASEIYEMVRQQRTDGETKTND